MTAVLIVEDSAPLGRLLAQTIERAGHASQWVASGADALDAVPSFKPEVVFIDMHLSDTDGASLAATLRTTLPSARLVGLSGEAPPPEVVGQFDTFLLKPVGLDTLLGVLEA